MDKISMNKIYSIKNELNSIDPKKIINDALSCSNKYNSENLKIKKDKLLEQTKNNTIFEFMNEIKKKNNNDLKKFLNEKLNEYQKGSQVIIDKNEKLKDEYKNKYNNILNEKENLIDQISILHKENNKLNEQIKIYQKLIESLQSKFETFNKNKELYDEFFKEYPNKNPIEIMKEIKLRENGYLSFLEEYHNCLNKIEEIKLEKNNEHKNNKLIIEDLSNKIYQNELNYKNNNINNLKIIESLKIENNKYKYYKEENINLHKMLFKLYNLLFDNFRLDKNIKINDKFLDIKETDFNPNLFDDNEIVRYIQIMINNMKENNTEKLLRETIAYSNMLIRKYLKNKNDLRYDPVNTFKNIKKIMEFKEDTINKLNDKIKNYEINIKQLENENKKLKYNIQQLEILQDKILSKSKSAHLIIKKNDDNKNKKRPFTSFKLKKNNINKNSILKKSFENAQSSIDLQNLLPKSFITSQISPKKIENSSKVNRSVNNFLTPKEKMRFKTLYYSKNNDKLYKTHGYQNLITQLNEFRELIEHTNRLFLYKDRINNKSKIILEQNKNNQRNNFKKIKQLNHSKSQYDYGENVKKKIINKIDNILKKL